MGRAMGGLGWGGGAGSAAGARGADWRAIEGKRNQGRTVVGGFAICSEFVLIETENL